MIPGRLARLALAAALAEALLAGCAPSVERTALIPDLSRVASKYEGAVRVIVLGAPESTWEEALFVPTVLVPPATVAEAVQEAIRRSGLFSRNVEADGADFQVKVELQRIFQPGAGLSQESQVSARWMLQALSPERTLWQELIVTTGTAEFRESLSGPTRARMAIERAVRKNIQQAIEEMSALDLPSTPTR